MTKEDYFSSKNKNLSNSKISDWLKGDKQYFYKKHITREITQRITDPMIIGSAVDTRLTESKKAFTDKYIVVSRRSKKNETPYHYQLNNFMAEQIERMCEKLEKTDVLKDLQKNYTSQEILQVPMDLGEHLDGLCGIPDWYSIKDNIITIIDLKTTQSANLNQYYWKCENLGYFRQQALYQMLLEKKYEKKLKKEITFKSYHLVVEKDVDKIYNSYLYILSQEKIEKEKEKIMEIIMEIKKEKDFKPNNLTWEMSQYLDNEFI